MELPPKMDAGSSIEKQIAWDEIRGAEEMVSNAERLERLAATLGGPAEAVKEVSVRAHQFRVVAMVKLNLGLGLGFPPPGSIKGVKIDVWEGNNN